MVTVRREPRIAASRSTTGRTTSSTGRTSSSGRSTPASRRLMSSTLCTIRSSRWASLSMVWAVCWRCAALQSRAGSSSAAGRGADRRERRPQVVRHGVQEGRLERLALLGDLGRGRLAGQRLAVEGQAELVGREGQEARLLARRIPRLARARAPQVAGGRAVGHDRHAIEARRARPLRRGPWRQVGADPAGGLVTGAARERGGHGADRRRRTSGRIGHDPLACSIERAQPRPIQARVGDQPGEDGRRGRRHVCRWWPACG